MMSLQKQGTHIFARNSRTDNAVLCARALCHEPRGRSNRLQFPFELASPSFSAGPGLQHNFSFTVTPGGANFYELPRENRIKYDELCLAFLSSSELPFCLWRLWRVPFPILLLGFGVVFEKPTSATCYDHIKKSSSVSSRSSISMRFFDHIQIIWNDLCTLFSCSNLV